MKNQTIVKISVSYMNGGKCVTNSFDTKTNNPQGLFDNAIADANLFASLHNGQVMVTRKVDRLYINYLDVNCELVDRMYLIAKKELKDEVKKTIDFFVESDKKIYGKVTEETKQAAKTQNVQI